MVDPEAWGWLLLRSCIPVIAGFLAINNQYLCNHSWLNWVDDDDEEVDLKEKPEDTKYIQNYIKIRPEAPGVWGN